MPKLDAQFVQEALGARISGPLPAAPFSGVSTDTRTLEPGQLFAALKGPNFDGHDFAGRAFEQGAAGALVHHGFSLPDACLLEVADTTAALGDLAGAWRREHSTLVVGLTGSNGKTTSKEMLASILGGRHRVLKTQGNLNNHIGLPLTLLQMTDAHTVCVAEMGMNAPGEIARLTEIAAPEVGVITNVGPAHLGPLGSMENIAKAKTELFRSLDSSASAVVNLDNKYLAPWAGKLDCRVVTFGLDPMSEVHGKDLSAVGSRQAFTLVLPGGAQLRVRLPAPGSHNVMNALAAAGAAHALGLGPDEIQSGLEAFKPAKGRLNLKRSFWGFQVVDDTYNANPASVAAGLEALKAVAAGRPFALILGDMGELGPTAADLHRQAGRRAGKLGCRYVMGLGKFAAQVAAGALEAGVPSGAALDFTDFETLVEAAREMLPVDSVVLVKGSRSARMERVAAALTTGEMD